MVRSDVRGESDRGRVRDRQRSVGGDGMDRGRRGVVGDPARAVAGVPEDGSGGEGGEVDGGTWITKQEMSVAGKRCVKSM